MTTFRRALPLFLVVLLAVATLFIWSVVFARDSQGELTVSFLDVGQGDAIFIETPHGRQILIDAGKGRAVLRALGSELSFFDRSIDVVVATHPDADHIGGLPAVFARYEVGRYFESGVSDDGADNQALQESVQNEGLMPLLARRGMTLALDDGVTLEVLFPDRDVSGLGANAASVILRLVYGDTAFVLTGDSPAAIEKYVAALYGKKLQANVLKLGHHGSKTSTSDIFLGFVNPEYAVVSAGCNNSYGHPHQEVVERVTMFDVEFLSTCKRGTITFISDGANVTVR